MNLIPIEELDAIKNILKLLKAKYSDAEMFNNKWWINFIDKYSECLDIAQTKVWFTYPISFIKIIQNYGMHIFEEYFKNTPNNTHFSEFYNWEYCPSFNDYCNNADIQFIYNIHKFYL